MANTNPAAVLDANLLVAGACRHEESPAYQILMAILHRRLHLILTEGIIAEYEDVLLRPAVRRLTGLTPNQSRELILDLVALSQQTQLQFGWRPNLADEADNKFIEAAIAGAAVIVTYNTRHFQQIDLVKHGWEIMTPFEFITLYDLEAT